MKRFRVLIALAVVTGGLSALAGYFGWQLARHYEANMHCCLLSVERARWMTVEETFGLTTYYSQSGQDKWLTEIVFPGVTDGYFLDVGSADGISYSNSKLLEEHGWQGICVDPFPTSMETRTCQLFENVVYDTAGQKVQFTTAGELGGVAADLGKWKGEASGSATVEFTTMTLGDILERAKAPSYIHYMSLDIEGAELKALRGLSLDKYRFGALTIEHNHEEPKRTEIYQLLTQHGYRRAFSWQQDDYYLPNAP
jgi:FkbM family methyltransferase